MAFFATSIIVIIKIFLLEYINTKKYYLFFIGRYIDEKIWHCSCDKDFTTILPLAEKSCIFEIFILLSCR